MVKFMTRRQIACYLIGVRLREELRRKRQGMRDPVPLTRDHPLLPCWQQSDSPPSA